MMFIKRIASHFVMSAVFAVVFCFMNLSADAQVKVVDGSEFYEAQNNYYEIREDRPYRSEYISETFLDGNIIATESIKYVRDRFGNSRQIDVRTGKGMEAETEQIIIEGRRFFRENAGAWKVEEPRFFPPTYRGPVNSSRECRQITVEDVFLDGVNAKLYYSLVFKPGKKGLDLEESKYWFGIDGMLLRTETVSGSYLPRIVTERVVKIYEYNPSEIVVAPK